jgi:endonuclease YncB( thermonuclease family)
MIRDGHAWHFKRYNKDEKLAEAETEAREAGRGLWADKEPTPPWEFRKLAKEKSKQLGEKSE